MKNKASQTTPNKMLSAIFYVAIYGSSIRKKILGTLLISIALYFMYNK